MIRSFNRYDHPSLEAFSSYVHELNKKWWYSKEGVWLDLNRGERVMLMISEVSEAMEGFRKSKPDAPLMDDKLPHLPMLVVELADTVIRVLDSNHAWGGRFYPAPGLNQDFVESTNKAERLFFIAECLAKAYRKDLSFEFSRVIIMCEIMCSVEGFDLWDIVAQKLEYNTTRKDHTYEAREAEGGKSF